MIRYCEHELRAKFGRIGYSSCMILTGPQARRPEQVGHFDSVCELCWQARRKRSKRRSPQSRDEMTHLRQRFFTATLVVVALAAFACQRRGRRHRPSRQTQAHPMPSVQPLLDFRNTNIQFNLQSLM